MRWCRRLNQRYPKNRERRKLSSDVASDSPSGT
jgi:hypothetical protein